MRIQFITYPAGAKCHQTEHNSGIKHPDFDDSVITDVTEFYLRFAADPDFKVNMLPKVYDINDPRLGDALIDADEPEFGEQDLEYMDNLRRQDDEKKASAKNQDNASDSEPS